MLAETFIILMVMFVVMMGPAVVIGMLGQAAIKALARNPSAASKIFLGVVLVIVFVVALSMIALLIIFQLFHK